MRALSIIALLVALLRGGASGRPPPTPYRIIVNPANPTTAVDRAFVRDAFFKKTIRWTHGQPIRPVDLHHDSPVRERFSAEVLGRSVAAVRAYWQQRIFAGREVPPAELEDSAAVVRFVLKHPGAIGYVAGEAPLEGTRALSVR